MKRRWVMITGLVMGANALVGCGTRSSFPMPTSPRVHTAHVASRSHLSGSSSSSHPTGSRSYLFADLSIHMTSMQDGWGWSQTGFYMIQNGGMTWTPVHFTLPLHTHHPWYFHRFDITPTGHLLTIAVRPISPSAAIMVTGIWSPSHHRWQWHTFSLTPLTAEIGIPESVSFFNTEEGWALFNQASSTALDQAGIYRTTNGGQSWSLTATPSRPGTWTGMSAASPGSTWATAAINTVSTSQGQPSINQPTSILYHSATHGQTWTTPESGQLLSPCLMGKNIETYTAEPIIWSSPDKGTMLVYTESRYHTRMLLEESANGGASWTSTPALRVSGMINPVLDVLSSQKLILVAGSTVRTSSDGGQIWHTIPLPKALLSSLRHHTLSLTPDFVSLQQGFLLARSINNNRVTEYKTSTAGRKWILIHPVAQPEAG
ncbi:MAG: hypothetical protein C7B43_18105 [Sulfobacillus benefaciens]|uniref:Photosynthesis system II assembly factor Ycf48/Hcf136-like domain-containing protein n=1 Tax=Sulfobacillus benefaciens TaxID=453960 RepID=A0A2T2WRJ6_9FIRM|nr:MAG: hypothetical protein C7B43_18105 [Sulfobacillus benefaciens]